jgi:2-hydroxychromene-2-carboxylate isomerase
MKLTWYFDFISPFAYLQHSQFNRLPNNVEVEYKPILLAGLLNHWQNVGPAEIPPKRVFTYQHCYWLAKKSNIPMTMPPAHPFNPLIALRAAIATGSTKESIQTIFEAIWKEGGDLNQPETFSKLEQKLDQSNLADLVGESSVKNKLRSNTEQAIESGVWGVPTFHLENTSQSGPQNFWGLDAFDMLLDYLESPNDFYDKEMLRIESLPSAIQRKKG